MRLSGIVRLDLMTASLPLLFVCRVIWPNLTLMTSLQKFLVRKTLCLPTSKIFTVFTRGDSLQCIIV